MAETRKCTACGAELPADAPDGLCASCQPTVSPDKTVKLTFPLTEKAGDKIGRYKLLEQIGEGGFGVVYVAEQEEPVRRRVALKVIKLGMDTKQVVARFEAERQALALMDHHNIAKVLDAGATDAGRPFFVMELVRGIPITEYCDKNNLTTRERIDLFIQVCQAIQHAHQKGIIHRDIKPSNILVTLHDGVPVPKVIDFGIAKATEQRLTDKTIYTAFQQFMGTPAYMSPEQAEMSGLDIDTRSDIYALGVLLYELLTGKTPFDQKELMEAGVDAMRRIIREKEPARPSTRLSTMLDGELTTTAKRRQTDAPKLVHLIRGDLDWIVMKALEKDRTRRYETANGLAVDIQRYLNNEPVMARPPSNLYRFQKLVRRNKVAFAAASAVAAALIIGLGLSTWLFFKEKDARQKEAEARQRAVAAENTQTRLREQAQSDEQKAKAEAAKSRQVLQFLKNMLNGVDAEVALGRDTTMIREILDQTADRIGKELTNEPEVEAEMEFTIGRVYEGLGEYGKAEMLYRPAINRQRKETVDGNLRLAESLNMLGGVLWEQHKLSEAETAHREALAIQRRLLGNEHREVAWTLFYLAVALRNEGKLDEAEAMHRAALAMQIKLLGQDQPDVAISLANLAELLYRRGRLAEAEKLEREGVELMTKLRGRRQQNVARYLVALSRILATQGKLSEAEDVVREASQIQRSLLPAEHPDLADSLSTLGSVLKREGKTDEAESVLREALSVYRKAADRGNASAQSHLGAMYVKGDGVAKDPVEAVKWYRKAAEHGDAYASVGLAWFLATCEVAELRDGPAAVNLAEKAVADTNRKEPIYLETLAAAYAETGQFPKAINAQREAISLQENDAKRNEYILRLKLYEANTPYREH